MLRIHPFDIVFNPPMPIACARTYRFLASYKQGCLDLDSKSDPVRTWVGIHPWLAANRTANPYLHASSPHSDS